MNALKCGFTSTGVATWSGTGGSFGPPQACDARHGWRITGRLPASHGQVSSTWLASAPVAFEGHKGFALIHMGSDQDRVDRVPEDHPGRSGLGRASLVLGGADLPSMRALRRQLASRIERGATCDPSIHSVPRSAPVRLMDR